MSQVPQTGDAVALFQKLLNTTWMGYVSDGNTPQGFTATMEAVDNEAVITTDVLVGPKGDKGDPAPLVDLQWPALSNPAELPDNLGAGDAGKGWWIGTVIYLWDGSEFHAVRPGPAGPAGETPQIAFTAEVIPMDERNGPGPNGEDIDTNVEITGTSLQPHIHLNLAAPQGEKGAPADIEDSTDYDSSKQKSPGQVLTVLPSGLWGPSDFAAKHPRLYTVPEAAFSSFTGLAQRHSVLQYTVPAQDYDWVPFVGGHINAFGVELDADPFKIGVEVRLGDPTSGQLIGRGFGNTSLWTTIQPHFSTTADPATAVSPDNGVAMVPAGQQAQIAVNLYNDGLIGAYIFNTKGAQLTILTVPQDSGVGAS